MIEPKSVLIVHLTDLHIKSGASPACARLKSIAGSIGALIEEPTIIVIAISGDIAFSGTAEQYEVAKKEIRDLIAQLRPWNPVDVIVVASPGNHDCDFKAMPDAVRNPLLEAFSGSAGDKDLLEALRPTNKEFNEFAAIISDDRIEEISPLVSRLTLETPGFSIEFLALNTAISSRLKERHGTLKIPTQVLPELKRDATCSILLAHHPLNWFDLQTQISLSEWIDRNSDLILLGHEHRLDEFKQVRARTGSSVLYEIGLPLDDPDGSPVKKGSGSFSKLCRPRSPA